MREAGKDDVFQPVQLLVQMIRLSDDALAEFFSRYVTGALDMYMQAKRGVQSLAAYSPLAQLPMAATDALTRMWMGAQPTYARPYGYQARESAGPAYGMPPPPPPDVDEPQGRPTDEHRSDDVAAMRRELDELKQAVRDGLGQRTRRKRPKG